VEPALIAPAESAIQAESSGFSPNGGKEHSTMEISILYGNAESIKSWKVEIVGNGAVSRTWSGDAANLSASLSWDGTKDGGGMSPEGSYTARLSIEYAKTYQPVSLESKSFVLDVTPPTGSLTLDPAQFTPSDTGVTGPLTVTIDAKSPLAKMDDWSLDIFDQAGALVTRFDGQWPTATATWDGSTLNGGFVSPSTTYVAVAKVRDEFGNSAELRADVPVADIPAAGQETSVQPKSAGFSPLSDSLSRSIDLALNVGNKDAVKSWKLALAQADMGVQKTWTGDASNLPQVVTWDGTTDAGVPAPDGNYTAILSIDYGKAFKPVLVKSSVFVLDVFEPAGNVIASPEKLAPDGKGGIQPVDFTVYATSSNANISGWSLSVVDASGKTVAGFNGTWPANTATWDGALAGGGKADPTKSYGYVARIRDQYGNVGEVQGSLATGELPVIQGALGIVLKSDGFSPNDDRFSDTMTLALSYGQPSAVTSWKVTIGYPGISGKKTFTGNGSNLPATLTWDGKTDNGASAPEGTYTAVLDINYGTMFEPAHITSAPFILDVTPPTGSITLSSPLFSPIEAADTITITLSANSPLAKIDSWSMEISDPAGNPFKSFSGKWPADQAVWDGKGINGDMVQSAEDYPVVARVRDQFGIVGELKTVIPIDILVEKLPTGYRILASRIFFTSFTADYRNVVADLAGQNAQRLDALAAKLNKFPGYRIRIVGHAVMIFWDNPKLGKVEQEQILIPLSKARAEAVKKALVERGLDEAMFTTDGVGASDQLVPDSNYKDRWQNRRVALYIEKE
jgi:flagellar hook assembly protein FlgD